MQRDPAQNWWTLVLDAPPESSSSPVAHTQLTVLPCTRLSEMERILEATPGNHVRFLVTGRVYVYRARNYILPSHAAVISMASPMDAAASMPDTGWTRPPAAQRWMAPQPRRRAAARTDHDHPGRRFRADCLRA